MNRMNRILICSIRAVAAVCLLASCEDSLRDTNSPLAEGKGVDVTLSIGLEQPQDAYDLTPRNTRTTAYGNTGTAACSTGFTAELVPAETKTRGNTELTPDALHNLEIGMYNIMTDALVYYKSLSSPAIGSYLTLESVPQGEYSLVLIARGSSNLLGSINGKTLAKVRTDISTSITNLAGLSATDQVSINKMPYALYLEKVKVTSDGKLISPDSPTDIRLLLKRLAARVTLKWNYNVSNYNLVEVSLQQVPKLYRPVPRYQGEVGGVNTYPSLVDEYVDAYRLDNPSNENTEGYTVWVPANVRGILPEVVNPSYRSKENAPTGAMFAEFRLENTSTQKRLFCRVYIGGNQTSDFNVRENTDYTWNVALATADVEKDDRVNEQDLKPITSNNLVTTSNCFMMEPGTDICFNPYKHEAGTGGLNTYLSDKTIDKVKLLWQSKDAGTSGELVLGYVATDDDHANLVNYANLGDRESARVYVKVPQTKGGNAVIAAYNSSNVIIWSWHLWITDYIPVPLSGEITDDVSREAAITAARAATANGYVQAYGADAWTKTTGLFYKKVIMDRNLGAIRNAPSPDNALDAARAYGYLYQWGRKDPFPGSVDGTNAEIGVMYNGQGKSLNLDKITGNSLDNAIRNPGKFIKNLFLDGNSWGGGTSKTIYDPCPAGWRVPDFKNTIAQNIFADMAMGVGNTAALVKGQWQYTAFANSEVNYDVTNGFLYHNEVWFPVFRLRESNGALRDPYSNGSYDSNLVPSYTMWGASANSTKGYYIESKTKIDNTPTANVSDKYYGFGVRCVQK